MKQRASDFALLVLIGLAVVPIGLLVISSMASGWLWPHVLPPAWSGRAWIYLTDPSSEIGAALRSSFAIATAVGFVSSILALPAARAFASYSFRFRGLAMGLLALPALVPPLASTMGLHRMLLWQDLTDTAFGVGLAHIVPALPYAVLVLTNSFRRIDPQLEWQARTLGASVFEVWRSVLIPLIAPGMAAAFALAFLISWS
ncbi:MAG TPA: ABC transporter permease subunit, partial [Bryobacteraceae bacterium]|nr:ABC transporter permease subunit [Bryobacteraceae bacterium]